MRRLIHPTIALCILTSLLIWPFLSIPGSALSAAQAPECTATGTPAATPASGGAEASPAVGDSGQAVDAATPVELEHGSALLWRGGERSVLLLHGAAYDAASWEAEAQAMVGQGFTVMAIEELAPDAVRDGIAYLTDACGASGVTMIGASAGGGAALEVLAAEPEGISGLILLSATGDVAALGEYPKLFVASEDEGLGEQLAANAEEAPGDQNETLILPGSAHAQAIFTTDQGEPLIEAILTFLDETAAWGD